MSTVAPARLALVSGASSGIGLAIAQHLLEQGWRVLGVSRTVAPIEHTAYEHLALDLSSPDQVAERLAHYPIQAFVHAAGFMRVGLLGQLNPADHEAMWRVHVLAAECVVNALAPRMEEGGRIVLIGSRAASGVANRSQYGATKAALIAMAKAWASELAPRRITCNVVSPAATMTPMLADPARAAERPKMPPIGRYIEPREIAATVGFLLSENAAAITGQNLMICGGSSL